MLALYIIELPVPLTRPLDLPTDPALHTFSQFKAMAITQLELTDAAVAKATSRLKAAKAQKFLWGRRRHVSGLASLPSMALIITAPLVVLCLHTALTQHNGSVTMALGALQTNGVQSFLGEYFPGFTAMSGLLYIGWVAFQALLYRVLPGRIAFGPPTPGGHSLPYRINGLWSWVATLAAFLVCVGTRKIDASFIAVRGGELLVAANIYGLLVTTICTVKCYTSTENTRDVRFSGQ